MIVLGARGAGGATSVLHGSVAGALAKTASCPVVIVRKRPQARYDALLVGTDGTAVSEPALAFSFRVASAPSWPLTVLHCFWDNTRSAAARRSGPPPSSARCWRPWWRRIGCDTPR